MIFPFFLTFGNWKLSKSLFFNKNSFLVFPLWQNFASEKSVAYETLSKAQI
jgi:hypothetical protein